MANRDTRPVTTAAIRTCTRHLTAASGLEVYPMPAQIDWTPGGMFRPVVDGNDPMPGFRAWIEAGTPETRSPDIDRGFGNQQSAEAYSAPASIRFSGRSTSST